MFSVLDKFEIINVYLLEPGLIKNIPEINLTFVDTYKVNDNIFYNMSHKLSCLTPFGPS